MFLKIIGWAFISLFLAWMLGFAAGSKARADINPDRFLACVAQVETGGKDMKGKNGECSRWQITRAVWSQHSKKPFASSHAEAERIAYAHLAWIRASLKRAGFPDWTFLAAVAWNGGLSRALKSDCPQRVTDYAVRVTNLYIQSDDELRVGNDRTKNN